jgi:hypothetical protein
MIIYYVFRLFTIEGPTKEEKRKAEEDRINSAREWIKSKWEGHKKNEENRVDAEKKNRERIKRDHLLGGAKGFIIKTEQATEDIPRILKTRTDVALDRAKSEIHKMKHYLRDAQKIIRAAKHGSKDEKREKLGHLYDYIEIIEDTLEDEVEKKLPKDDKDAGWDAKVTHVKTQLTKIRIECGHAIRSIDKFIDEDKLEIPVRTTP